MVLKQYVHGSQTTRACLSLIAQCKGLACGLVVHAKSKVHAKSNSHHAAAVCRWEALLPASIISELLVVSARQTEAAGRCGEPMEQLRLSAGVLDPQRVGSPKGREHTPGSQPQPTSPPSPSVSTSEACATARFRTRLLGADSVPFVMAWCSVAGRSMPERRSRAIWDSEQGGWHGCW